MTKQSLGRLLAAGVVAGLVFVIFFPQPYKPMIRPNDQSFDGRWVLDSASLPSVKKRVGKTPANSQIVFGSDGRVKVADMPYEDGLGRKPEFTLLSGEGRWNLQMHQDWVMTLFIEGRPVTLDIRLKDGLPTALTHAVGDPDSIERWIWRRAP